MYIIEQQYNKNKVIVKYCKTQQEAINFVSNRYPNGIVRFLFITDPLLSKVFETDDGLFTCTLKKEI